MDDPHDLNRFLAAQAPVMATVRAELAAGRKRSHWMWFVFPQLRGLGQSETARHYGIAGREEAAAYLAHPVLGPRLLDCAGLVREAPAASAEALFGPVDALKLRSCMSLFALVAPERPAFRAVLDRYFAGQPDLRTAGMLEAPGG